MANLMVEYLWMLQVRKYTMTNIVMLHGLFGCPDDWSLMPDLLYEYRIFVPQLPINTQHIRNDFSFDVLTDFVFNFFNNAGIDKAVLIGNSLGGQIAIDFCLKHHDMVDKLVLVGSAGLHEGSLVASKYPRRSLAMVREKTEEIFYDNKYVTDELVCKIHKVLNDRRYLRFLLKITKATRNRNMKDEIGLLDIPTLIIWGENDIITNVCVAEEFHRGIMNSKLFFIPSCGHVPQIEKPKEFAEILREFLP